jgi:hypothetical protein
MGFVKPNALHGPGLSVGEDHGLADQLSLGLREADLPCFRDPILRDGHCQGRADAARRRYSVPGCSPSRSIFFGCLPFCRRFEGLIYQLCKTYEFPQETECLQKLDGEA